MSDVLTPPQVELLYGIPLVELPTYAKKPPVGTEELADETEVNLPLLNKIMDFIEKHPETWYQANWYQVVNPETGDAKQYVKIEEVEDANECRTSYCFAGHVALHEGFPYPKRGNGGDWYRDVIDSDGYEYSQSAESFATQRLGLSLRQAGDLFDESNTLVDLRNMVNALNISPDVSYLDEFTGYNDVLSPEQLNEKIAIYQ